MATERDAAALFDAWAATYDADLEGWGDAFPFAGDDAVHVAVVDAVAGAVARVAGTAPARVLDVGCGTGTLLRRLVAAIPEVEPWGLDASPRMLAEARRRVPSARFVEADLAGLPALALPRFVAVVSSYVLHGVTDEAKATLIEHVCAERLLPGGLVAVADIAFADAAHRAAVHASVEAWDDAEHYLAADGFVARLARAGLAADYRQVSFCAGVLTVAPAPRPPAPLP